MTRMIDYSSLDSPNGLKILCENLVATEYKDLSEDNIRIFKDRLLDMVGCIFGGACVEEDRFLVDLYCDWGGKPEAPIFARKERIPAINAVSVNSILARANDYGNMVTNVHGDRIASHFGESLIPTNLTFADMQGVSGEDFITRNIAAEDTIARILYTLPERWPVDMLLGSSACAALCARIYGFDADQARAAMSYAATNNSDPGNAYFDYSQEFKFYNGECARVGMMSCEVVKHGWRGIEDAFFGHWGIISNQLKDGSRMPALYEKTFEYLGSKYFTESSFKRGPGGIPTTVAGNLGKALRGKLIEKYGKLNPEQIRQVHVWRSRSMRDNYYSQPFSLRNHINALFSYQFAVCCCLLNGDRNVANVQTASILANPVLVELTENSTMGVYDCTPGKQMMKAAVEMTDGSTVELEMDYSSAMNEYPSREFLIAKFYDQFNTFGKLPKSVGKKIVETADKIETLPDMREFTELLTLK